MENNGKILWADDEIDLLKPHIMFLKMKGYDVTTVNNGADALDRVETETFDIIILDENMPGISGLETLQQIKQVQPNVPVIMITKSEEENIMNQAIGNKIADYLIKPVNPNQILMSLKKNLHSGQLVSQKATSDYQQEFRNIARLINESDNIDDWYELYRKLVFWEMDNFRLDQWRITKPILAEWFNIEEDLYTTILPTATQYARNAIFSGLMPLQIEKMFPELWVDEDSEEGKNLNESPLIQTQLDRFRKRYKFSYNKIYESSFGERLLQNFSNFNNFDLNVIVFNFIDMLSHARTESKMIRELASSNAAYRSLTESWFRHSSASDLLRRIAESGARVVLTTDHGTIRVDNPIKVVGDKATNTNLRYKLGKNLGYNERQVYEIKQPERFGLPAPNISTKYIFTTNRDFFAYPNNFNYYVQYYKDTFQHGGISMEEMLVPIITMQPK